MSRDPQRKRPKPKRRGRKGQSAEGKGFAPGLLVDLCRNEIGAPPRPRVKSRENVWGSTVTFPESMTSKLFSVADVVVIREPDTFYNGLKGKLVEFLAFDQVWKVK